MKYAHSFSVLAAFAMFGFISCQKAAAPTKAAKQPEEKKLNAYWTELTEMPSTVPSSSRQYPAPHRLLKLDLPALRRHLGDEPGKPATSKEVAVPLADNTMEKFRVSENKNVHPQLLQQKPGAKLFSGNSPQNGAYSLRFDISAKGFSGIVTQGPTMTIIEPYAPGDTVYYVSYSKAKPATDHLKKRVTPETIKTAPIPNNKDR